MLTTLFYIWSDSPALSLAIWLVICITLLYAGRPHGHQLLRSTGRAVYTSLRLAATSLRQLEQRVRERNRDVLLAMGREASEKSIEREFQRINTLVVPDGRLKIASRCVKVFADTREVETMTFAD